MDTIKLDLKPLQLGDKRFQFTEAEFTLDFSPMVIVWYAISGKQHKTGLRLDMGKLSFIDHLDNPEWESIAKQSTSVILKSVQEYFASSPAAVHAARTAGWTRREKVASGSH